MLGSAETIKVVADVLQRHKVDTIVLDPVSLALLESSVCNSNSSPALPLLIDVLID